MRRVIILLWSWPGWPLRRAAPRRRVGRSPARGPGAFASLSEPKAWALQCRFGAPGLSSCSRRDIRRRRRCRSGPPAGASASGCPAGRHRSSSTAGSARRRSSGPSARGRCVAPSDCTEGGCPTGAPSGSTRSPTGGRSACSTRRSSRGPQRSSTPASCTRCTRCGEGRMRSALRWARGGPRSVRRLLVLRRWSGGVRALPISTRRACRYGRRKCASEVCEVPGLRAR